MLLDMVRICRSVGRLTASRIGNARHLLQGRDRPLFPGRIRDGERPPPDLSHPVFPKRPSYITIEHSGSSDRRKPGQDDPPLTGHDPVQRPSTSGNPNSGKHDGCGCLEKASATWGTDTAFFPCKHDYSSMVIEFLHSFDVYMNGFFISVQQTTDFPRNGSTRESHEK